MMARPDRDAAAVDDGADVMGMGAVHGKGYDGRLVLRLAIYGQTIDARQPLGSVSEQSLFVAGNLFQPDIVYVVDGGGQADGLDDRRRPGLKPGGRFPIGGFLESDVFDHVTTALVGRHGVENIQLAVQGADAGRPIQLVAGESVEIHVQRLHVHRAVHNALGTVDQHFGPGLVGQVDALFDRDDGAENVGHLGHRHQLGLGPQQFFVFLHEEITGIVDGHDLDDDPRFVPEQLPGHDVGVMLHMGEDNLVAFLEEFASIGMGYQIDRRRDIAGKDDLVVFFGVEETGDLGAGLLVIVGGFLAQVIGAPMHVGVFTAIGLVHPLDYHFRLLGAGARIQKGDRIAVDFQRQCRKVGADGVNIVGVAFVLGHYIGHCSSIHFLLSVFASIPLASANG